MGRLLDTLLLLYKELQADSPAVNTLRLGYKDQHVNVVYGDDSYVKTLRSNVIIVGVCVCVYIYIYIYIYIYKG